MNCIENSWNHNYSMWKDGTRYQSVFPTYWTSQICFKLLSLLLLLLLRSSWYMCSSISLQIKINFNYYFYTRNFQFTTFEDEFIYHQHQIPDRWRVVTKNFHNQSEPTAKITIFFSLPTDVFPRTQFLKSSWVARKLPNKLQYS